jgi:chemotaxis protein MotB
VDEETQETTPQPIIVKKKKGGHGGHHGGAWKVAYADFVTAMMAFFLVMWIVSLDDTIKENVAQYFRDPGGFSGAGAEGVLPGKSGLFKDGSGERPVNELRRAEKSAEIWKSLEEVGKRISDKLKSMQSFSRYKNQIEIELTKDGLRILLIENNDKSSFFASGSAEMSEDGKAILEAISAEIAKLSYNVVIEGHTDSRRYREGANYTNWELSADRANTARRVMLEAGMAESRIKEIRGFAANQPRFANDPANPGNRRIAIIVLNEYADSDYRDVLVSSDEDFPKN